MVHPSVPCDAVPPSCMTKKKQNKTNKQKQKQTKKFFCYTPAGNNLGPVTSLVSNKTTATSWTLSWKEQAESRCQTDYYKVEYALINKDQCKEVDPPAWKDYGTVTDTEITIVGLDSYSTYEVLVYASNNFGAGKSASISDKTTESGSLYHFYS